MIAMLRALDVATKLGACEGRMRWDVVVGGEAQQIRSKLNC